MAVCIVACNQLGKWILPFNIYGNWAGRGKCPRYSISGMENILEKYVQGEVSGSHHLATV